MKKYRIKVEGPRRIKRKKKERETEITSYQISTECLKLMYTLLEMLFFSNKMRQKYNLCCVLFLKLPYARTYSKCPLSATVHSQRRHRTE